MAVTTLTATQLALNTVSADLPVTGMTAIDATKTMEVAYPQQGKLLLVLNNTYAGEKVFTISAGEYLGLGQGAYAIAMAQADVRYLVVDSMRHKKMDGVLEISFAASTTGFVGAFLIP